jgi:hypothetical protein
MARRHRGRPQRSATDRSTPARPRQPSFPTATRKRLAPADTHTEPHWRQLLATEVPSVTADPFLPELAERLHNFTRAGFDATLLVSSAAAAAPLPDHHPRGSAQVAHSRSTTPTSREPRPSDNQHRPTDAAHAHEVRGAAATRAALGAASRLRPEPLNLTARPINTAEVGLGGLSPNPSSLSSGAAPVPRRVSSLQRGPLRVGTRGDALRDPASGTSRSIRAGLTRHLNDADVEVHQDVRLIGARPRRISCRICLSARNVRSSLPFADGGPAAVL